MPDTHRKGADARNPLDSSGLENARRQENVQRQSSTRLWEAVVAYERQGNLSEKELAALEKLKARTRFIPMIDYSSPALDTQNGRDRLNRRVPIEPMD